MGAFDVVPNIVIPDPDKPEEAAAFRRKWKWEAHEQIIIRGQYTTDIQEAVENAGSGMKGEGNKKEAEMRIGTGRRKMLELMIVDWTLAVNGRRTAVTPQMIGRLPANYRTPVLEKCDEIAVGMTEEEQEVFLPSANGHSEETSVETNQYQTLS